MKLEFNESIEKMLLHTSFENLTQKDKATVLEHMTQSDYKMYQSLIGYSKTLPGPPRTMGKGALSEIKGRLEGQLVSEVSVVDRLTGLRIPAWLGLGLTLIGFGIAQLFSFNKTTPINDKPSEAKVITVLDTIFVNTVDTIYKEIISDPIVEIREVIKEVYIEKSNPLAVTPREFSAIIPENQKAYYADYETTQLLAPKSGQSVGSNDEIMELLDEEIESSVKVVSFDFF